MSHRIPAADGNARHAEPEKHDGRRLRHSRRRGIADAVADDHRVARVAREKIRVDVNVGVCVRTGRPGTMDSQVYLQMNPADLAGRLVE